MAALFVPFHKYVCDILRTQINNTTEILMIPPQTLGVNDNCVPTYNCYVVYKITYQREKMFKYLCDDVCDPEKVYTRTFIFQKKTDICIHDVV